MQIISVSSQKYSKADNSQIDCTIVSNIGTFSFTARPDDIMDYGRKLYNDLVAGLYGNVAAFS